MGAGNIHRSLEVTGLVEEQKRLERMMMQDPLFEQKVQKIIDTVLVAVRKGVVSAASSVMDSDPRGAARAVRRSVYKRILGGQVNILKKRRAGRTGDMPDSNANQWWRRRGYKTGQMSRYLGSDRGFILRFLNKGTEDRVSKTMDAHPIKRKSTAERPKSRRYVSNTIGYRGRTGSRGVGFFDKSEQLMRQQLPELEQLIGHLVEQEFNKQ